MADRLGLAVIPGTGWRATEIQAVAREAEEAGFDAIFAAEVNNDVMATAQLMGAATRRLQVGTWIANIYLRHPYACAQGAALIADATNGRFVLGLGVSHPPVNAALGIDMGDTSITLRRYVTAVRGWLKGEGPPTHLPQRPSAERVPIYVAAVTSRTVELACELGDGLMPFLWSAERVKQSRSWIERGRAKARDLGRVDVTLGLPTFIGDDLGAMREAARANLGLYTTFPFFQRLFRASGFTMEADQMEKNVGGPSLSDRILDAMCLMGPLTRCQEQLATFRAAGVDLPILVPPIGIDNARAVIKAFRR
ncbi:MAG TPA: LLM class flavin-dependent oxidoreductase [Methylomirabilota bacterium]|jgi:alkanesulfonate monooxygenase SsuD/methylene tetrahydromethanopterin reductase-like flavin-dependent oxidoreductase (luciferase family)|nr:LLM class flavin-dependent oxidoreductase [Methylomirabilota bacterium]